MNYIELLYILASVASVIVMYPQIKKLLITKQSDELSLTTWGVWASYQVIALFYAISLFAVPYILVNIVWIIFYGIMLVLIFKYRNNTSQLASETNDSNVDNVSSKSIN